jgi:hypothetical protein
MYRTFLRSCTNWTEFANSPKVTQETGLTLEEARERCKEFNDNLTDEEKEKGTKLEFDEE